MDEEQTSRLFDLADLILAVGRHIEASKEADLLVVGSKGHRAFTGMLLGSVSLHCVTGASCPVVVVHGTDHH